jgi:hypothetical protein
MEEAATVGTICKLVNPVNKYMISSQFQEPIVRTGSHHHASYWGAVQARRILS